MLKTDLTEDEKLEYPHSSIEVSYKFSGLTNNRIPFISKEIEGLVPGASYVFEVTTISDGEDMTVSDAVVAHYDIS